MVEMKKLKVCWISAGVSSFVAGYLERDTIDEYIYIDIEDQHEDSMRFVLDCEKFWGRKSKFYNLISHVLKMSLEQQE